MTDPEEIIFTDNNLCSECDGISQQGTGEGFKRCKKCESEYYICKSCQTAILELHTKG